VSLIGLVEGNGSQNSDNSIDQSIFHDLIISDVRNLLGGKDSLSWGALEVYVIRELLIYVHIHIYF
jgi:hypothetical protein